jgi:hypothetical protein
LEFIVFLFMGLCFGISALGLIGGAVWAYFKQRQTLESRVATTGTVVELTTQVTQRSNIFCPVVEFTTVTGEKIRFTSAFGSRPAGHEVGQSVNVRYQAADPQKAEIESTLNRWLVPLILGLMGVIAGCMGTVFLGFYGLGVSP